MLNFCVVKSKMTSALNISLWMLFCGLGVCTSALQLVLKTLNIQEYSGSGVKTHCDITLLSCSSWSVSSSLWLANGKEAMSSANRTWLHERQGTNGVSGRPGRMQWDMQWLISSVTGFSSCTARLSLHFPCCRWLYLSILWFYSNLYCFNILCLLTCMPTVF